MQHETYLSPKKSSLLTTLSNGIGLGLAILIQPLIEMLVMMLVVVTMVSRRRRKPQLHHASRTVEWRKCEQ